MAEAFIAAHGTEVANTIMDHLPPAGWSDLATKTDLATQGLLLRSELRSEMSDLRTELKSEMSDLRTELKSEMSDLRKELATGFAHQLKWLVGTMVALFTVMSGLISVLVVVAK